MIVKKLQGILSKLLKNSREVSGRKFTLAINATSVIVGGSAVP